MALNVENFIIDQTPYRESSGVNHLIDARARQQAMAYRQQRDAEEDQWKKLNLIQNLTDLSKHQTGSDVANAIGSQQANKVFQKYTASSKGMSPAELQYNISKDMQGVIGGLDAMKNELTQSDQQVAAIKQAYPDLDIAKIAQDYRADILNRRLKNHEEFMNPIEVQPSSMKLDDPEFLSRYVTGDKNLRTYFQNPQGMDEVSVYKGNPNSFTKYTAKIPSYKKVNYDPNSLQSGFLPKGVEPRLSFKSSTLPSDALPNSNGKPFEMMDKDIYDGVTGKEKLELLASTRKKYPNYDQFNTTEKEYAQRNVLLDKAKAFDQTDFHPTEVHTPSASLLKFYAGGDGGKKGEPSIRDIYEEVSSKTSKGKQLPFGLGNFVPLNDLSATAQTKILEYANKLLGSGMTQGDVVLSKDKSGTINMIDPSTWQVIAPIDFGDVNVPAQPSVKEKRKVIEETNRTYKHNGKTYTHSDVEKAASRSGMSIEDYIKKAGLK